MDVSETILAKSDQVNASDLIEPVIVTVVDVKAGPADQPVHIITDKYGKDRPFKPSKTVRRDLAKAWGTEAKAWIGRQMELYNEPTVLWAGKPVGGIRVSALSHIEKPIQTAHTITRGKYLEVTIGVIATPAFDESAVVDVLAEIANADSLPGLKAVWDVAGVKGVQKHPDVVAATNKRKAELS
ncbi:hypothetical protein ACTJJ4_11740 [Microbacterium sp. 22195]|uniref:hypothetical protein n=1 Tax=Microbacterium sp. 22195 TaxID=3453891 RepID=UPI003F873C9E